jgi:metal-responsive CopG/Arc/MetJ family transcriptional regulator
LKTLRISEDAHQKLTALLGELTAQTMKMQTYTDAIESLLGQSVMLPPELLAEVEAFIQDKRHLGYTTKEEFFRDAARWRLKSLSDDYESVEVRKDVYDKLESAIQEMDLPFVGVSDFIDEQLKTALEQYAEWKEQAEAHEK